MKQLFLGALALSFLMVGCNVEIGKEKKEATEKKAEKEKEETAKPVKAEE